MLLPDFPPLTAPERYPLRTAPSVDGGVDVSYAATIPGSQDEARAWNERIGIVDGVWAQTFSGLGAGIDGEAQYRMQSPVVTPDTSPGSVQLVVRSFAKHPAVDEVRYARDLHYRIMTDAMTRWMDQELNKELVLHWIAAWILHPSISLLPASAPRLRRTAQRWRDLDWVGMDIETTLLLDAAR